MEITYTEGDRFEGDKKFFMTTRSKEPFSILKIAVVMNQLAGNEAKRGFFDDTTGRLLLKQAVIEAIDMGVQGTDWSDKEKNEKVVHEFCRKYHLSFEPIDGGLQALWQTKLKDFEGDENGVP